MSFVLHSRMSVLITKPWPFKCYLNLPKASLGRLQAKFQTYANYFLSIYILVADPQ